MARFSLLFLVLLGTLVANDRAQAVEVDPNGSGQVLILPLWTTTGGHATLLNVQPPRLQRFWVSGNPLRPIVRLRLLDGEGNVVLSGNLYFRNNEDSWAAGIGAREGGGSRLVSNDVTCLLIAGDNGVEPFSGAIDLEADFGSMEMIVMGDGWSAETSTEDPAGCAALSSKWNDGDWSEEPETGVSMGHDFQLRGEWQIVNVERGTLFQVPGVALDDYSDRVQHTPPGDPLPNLASGHGPQTDEGVTSSRTCSDRLCREDTWPTPLDAMAAALMVSEVSGSYNILPETGSTTDLVLTNPLQTYFSERDGPEHPLASTSAAILTAGRGGGKPTLCDITCPGTPVCYDIELVHTVPVQRVTFSPFPEGTSFVESALLGLPGAAVINWIMEYPGAPPYYSLPSVGVFQLFPACDPGRQNGRPSLALTSREGRKYYGLPVIPVVFQQSVNGVLTTGDGTQQRANYGAAFAPSSWAWPREE